MQKSLYLQFFGILLSDNNYSHQGKIFSVKTGKIKHKASIPRVKSFIVNLISQDNLDMHPLNNKVNFGVVKRYRH